MIVLPSPYRCAICGHGEICSGLIARNGYCLKPEVRAGIVARLRDFCSYCGANKPPIEGEGTCGYCDPEGTKRNKEKNENLHRP